MFVVCFTPIPHTEHVWSDSGEENLLFNRKKRPAVQAAICQDTVDRQSRYTHFLMKSKKCITGEGKHLVGVVFIADTKIPPPGSLS